MNAALFKEGMKALFIAGLAVAVPFFALSDRENLESWFTADASEESASDGEVGAKKVPEKKIVENTSGIVAPKVTPQPLPRTTLEESLRFDRSPAWVQQHWQGYCTVLHDGEYYSCTVPLTTGGEDADVVGYLTYHFDMQQQLQRILLRGATNDFGGIALMLRRYYGFMARPDQAPHTVILERTFPGSTEASRLWIEAYVGQLKLKEPRKYYVTLVLNRPGGPVEEPREPAGAGWSYRS